MKQSAWDMKAEKEKLEHLLELIYDESSSYDVSYSYDEESVLEEFGTFLKTLPVDLVDIHFILTLAWPMDHYKTML